MVSPRWEHSSILNLVAWLASRGPVSVIDASGGFDAHQLAHLVRQQTQHHIQALSQIHLARAQNGAHLLKLLKSTPSSTAPLLVIDLLSVFYEEPASSAECYRMLGIAVGQLNRLRRYAPVALSIHPPRVLPADRIGMLEVILEIVDRIEFLEHPPADRRPPRLP